MRRRLVALALILPCLAPRASHAVGPTIAFTLPAENTTPGVFGSLPFPNDLYFDQGEPGDGDGTLLNAGASIGLAADVARANTATFEDAFDVLEGFGTTTAVYFFSSGPLDPLPGALLAPTLSDPVFCADAATGIPVPILVKRDVDSRIPNVLALLPAPGRPLVPRTTYTCVVRRSVTGGGEPVEPSADWALVRDGPSANTDADSIHDPVVALLGGLGVMPSDIAAMTVFTTEPTADDLLAIQNTVLPGLPVPTADLTSRPELVFDTPAELTALLGTAPSSIAKIATGFYEAPRFQSLDPDGDGPLHDLPLPPSFVTCAVPCETADERFTHAGGTPVVVATPEIPFTVVVPSGTPPPGGWPVIIQQHGLGGQRDTVVAFAAEDAARGFASIGIDAVAHGYRYFKDMTVAGDCTPARPCPQDTANNFGGTAVPDGFVDGSYLGFSVSFLTVNLGFFQGFHNFVGIRDNFRQTYADLMSLVRLLQGHSIDSALGTTLDAGNIFYVGHSLGGLMGSGFVPIEPDLAAALLNATGGGLTTQLFLNSSIGAGAQALVQGILGLDPANVTDQFALQPNLTQMVIDPADGVNLAHLLLAPVDGAPRNVVQVEDFGDQVVPNQANEVLAVAGGFELFDPFVQNLHASPFVLPIANSATPKTVRGNAAGGLATAVLLQNGPATHAASLGTIPGTLTFVPEFARVDEFPLTGNAFPLLERSVRVPNVGIFDEVLDWFSDIIANGPPGTFSLADDPNFNPIQNVEVPAGASVATFFSRTVDAGGALATSEPTPDVVLAFSTNAVTTRVTAARSILGTTPLANDRDAPPGPGISVGTPGVLPFFVGLQRLFPGLMTAELTIGYTTAELATAGVTPGSGAEGSLLVWRFTPGACTIGAAACAEDSECGINGPCVGAAYTPFLDTQIDLGAHTATASGVTSLSTFALMSSDALAVYELGGSRARTDCRAQWRILNPNAPAPTPASRRAALQSCQDGDASCDADGPGNAQCSFRVAICFDRLDPLVPDCFSLVVDAYTVIYPSPAARRPRDRDNARALVDALAALGGTVGGPRQNEVTFAAPLGGGQCTPLTTLVVPAGRRSTFRGRAQTNGLVRQRDTDKLRLRCLP